MDYVNVDLCVTLRCTAACRNCVRLCNHSGTGLSYADSDMTMGQVLEFVRQVEALDHPTMINCITVSGGEPLLHPQVEAIVALLQERLVDSGRVRVLRVNSNLTLPIPPALAPYVYNTSEPRDNPDQHYAALLHPSEFARPFKRMTYADCTYHGKHHVVVTYQGVSVCCVADGYVRLLGLSGLLRDTLPQRDAEWGEGMDSVCAHCPFGHVTSLPLERDVGAPVSKFFAAQAAINLRGHRIERRFPEFEEKVP